MRPIDYRNATWSDLERCVEGLREHVYVALQQHGPCTTRQLAQKSGIDILSVRPRVTELYQLGFAELANPEPGGGEGIYRAVPWILARNAFEKLKAAATEKQLSLL